MTLESANIECRRMAGLTGWPWEEEARVALAEVAVSSGATDDMLSDVVSDVLRNWVACPKPAELLQMLKAKIRDAVKSEGSHTWCGQCETGWVRVWAVKDRFGIPRRVKQSTYNDPPEGYSQYAEGVASCQCRKALALQGE